ncbi:MAG TPA: hypothetical protein VJC16_05570 [Candidatus Nanoarchaeia archaeon]|nr:hypothetical protein [Candidatus Nanoarchaeia archaeon]
MKQRTFSQVSRSLRDEREAILRQVRHEQRHVPVLQWMKKIFVL